MKNKYIYRISSIIGDSPIILLFSIYITLFIFIKNINHANTVLIIGVLVCILKTTSTEKFLKALFISIVLLIISMYFLPGEISEGKHSVVGEVVSIQKNYYDLKISKSSKEILEKPLTVRVYDEIKDRKIGSKGVFSLEIKYLPKASNPGQFSSKAYLESIGISSLGTNCEFKESVAQSKIKYLTIRIRKILSNRFNNMPKDLKAISIAMLLGDKTNLDKNIKNSYASTGLSHLLVVSGLHLTILVALLKLLLSKFLINEKKQSVILIIFIWVYAYITGFSFSILRASIMISSLIIINACNKDMSKLENIILAALLILVIYPYALHNIGWQLSFLATFGLLILSDKIQTLLPSCKFEKPLAAILSVQVMTIPFVINTFNSLSPLIIPANLIMVPFTTFILSIGLLAMLPVLNVLLMPGFTFLIKVHLSITCWLSELDGFIYFIKSWPVYLVFLYYCLIFICLFTDYKNLKKVFFLIFLSFVLIVNIEIYPEIVFLDVGQGDCTYINTGIFNGNKKILIDSGDSSDYFDSGRDIIIPFLKSKGIKEINILIISHPHKDHIGGIVSLIDSIVVEECLLSYQAYQSDKELLYEIISKLKEDRTRIKLVDKGDEILISKNDVISVLHPAIDDKGFDENNSSLVLNLSLDNINILFTGDIENQAENFLIEEHKEELKANILKIPHHGSKTSSSEKFIDEVNPEIAINSSGRNHFLNHPDKEVIMRYNNKRVNVFRTDINGAIIIKLTNPLRVYSFYNKKEEKIWLQQQWKS
ncbi:MAG: DNA internalization-related competence protein ComEC/Rec2 [Clostridia bacterium]